VLAAGPATPVIERARLRVPTIVSRIGAGGPPQAPAHSAGESALGWAA
jgi:hypothetical protein